MDAATWANIGTAVGTALLAVATFRLARRTAEQSDANRAQAAAGAEQAKAATAQAAASSEQATAATAQAAAASEQTRLLAEQSATAERALRASIRPLLVDVPDGLSD